MFKAVIFDMDGLMVDSEPLHLQAFNEVLKKYGKHLSVQDNNNFYYGKSDLVAAEDMVDRFNIPLSPEELIHQKEIAGYSLLLTTPPRPGLIDLLEKIKQLGIKMAIASNSRLETIQIIVDAIKITDYFQAICSFDDVEQGKPAPDVYLAAARKLGVDPKDCLVLEDSTTGVQAGVTAGMTVFAIPSEETRNKDFSQAAKVLNNLSQVLQFIS